MQGDLFQRDTEQLQQYHQTCDRLRARLGEQALQHTQLHADHRPEQAFRYQQAALSDHAATGLTLPRPCWLLPQPQPLREAPQLLAGPERIEAGWWEGRDCTRDYYLAQDAAGAQLWVFRDLNNGAWFLHGLWS
jgi:protein ImuB